MNWDQDGNNEWGMEFKQGDQMKGNWVGLW